MQIQLTAETERAAQLKTLHEKAEQEVIGLEAEVEHLSSKVEDFKRQLEEVENSRGQGEDVLHVELDKREQEVLELKAAVEEAKARNTKLMQDNLTLNARTDNALREVRRGMTFYGHSGGRTAIIDLIGLSCSMCLAGRGITA